MTSKEYEELQMQHGKIIDFCFIDDVWHFEFEDHFVFDDPESLNVKVRTLMEKKRLKRRFRNDD